MVGERGVDRVMTDLTSTAGNNRSYLCCFTTNLRPRSFTTQNFCNNNIGRVIYKCAGVISVKHTYINSLEICACHLNFHIDCQ